MDLISSTSSDAPLATSIASQGREAGRPASADADQIRDGDQPQNRESARPRNAAGSARPRRRGDRINANRNAGTVGAQDQRDFMATRVTFLALTFGTVALSAFAYAQSTIQVSSSSRRILSS